jgi:hypothetical protein
MDSKENDKKLKVITFGAQNKPKAKQTDEITPNTLLQRALTDNEDDSFETVVLVVRERDGKTNLYCTPSSSVTVLGMLQAAQISYYLSE